MNRRELGKENVMLLDGSEKEITIYAIGFVEKLNIIKKYTKTNYIKGFSYKDVDEMAIMQEILSKAIEGVSVEELDYNAQEIYEKYFKPSEKEKKKEHTSTTSHSVTN